MARMKLQFSIRDWAWLTLVVAILLLWWLDHRYLSNTILGLMLEKYSNPN